MTKDVRLNHLNYPAPCCWYTCTKIQTSGSATHIIRNWKQRLPAMRLWGTTSLCFVAILFLSLAPPTHARTAPSTDLSTQAQELGIAQPLRDGDSTSLHPAVAEKALNPTIKDDGIKGNRGEEQPPHFLVFKFQDDSSSSTWWRVTKWVLYVVGGILALGAVLYLLSAIYACCRGTSSLAESGHILGWWPFGYFAHGQQAGYSGVAPEPSRIPAGPATRQP